MNSPECAAPQKEYNECIKKFFSAKLTGLRQQKDSVEVDDCSDQIEVLCTIHITSGIQCIRYCSTEYTQSSPPVFSLFSLPFLTYYIDFQRMY